MFKNLFNYKQASSEKNYGLAKIFSEEKNRTEIFMHRMLLIIFKKMQVNVYTLERLEGSALSYLKDFKQLLFIFCQSFNHSLCSFYN